jgi:hypothetical protein
MRTIGNIAEAVWQFAAAFAVALVAVVIFGRVSEDDER